MGHKRTIEEAERQHPDLVKGQKWCGVNELYKYVCKEHGEYPQTFHNHDSKHGCPRCAKKNINLTIEKAEKQHPDMIKGQQWRGVYAKYKYVCKRCGGVYPQSFERHDWGQGCPKCDNLTAGGLSRTPEYRTVVTHFHHIFHSRNDIQRRSYKGMPFYDGWNPRKKGAFYLGAQWIIENLGKRPNGCTMHIVDHEKGFMPGNLIWTSPKEQTAKQMYKIIADLRHEIKGLKRQLESQEKA